MGAFIENSIPASKWFDSAFQARMENFSCAYDHSPSVASFVGLEGAWPGTGWGDS
jgi:hypothetical protein